MYRICEGLYSQRANNAIKLRGYEQINVKSGNKVSLFATSLAQCLRQAIAQFSVEFTDAYNRHERSQQELWIVFILGVMNDKCDSWATPRLHKPFRCFHISYLL